MYIDINNLQERIVAIETREKIRESTQDEILQHVKAIDANLNKYKGILGACWFLISCVGIFFSAFKFFNK